LAASQWMEPEQAITGYQALSPIDGAIRYLTLPVEVRNGIDYSLRIVVAEPGDCLHIFGTHQLKQVAVTVCLPKVDRHGSRCHRVRER